MSAHDEGDGILVFVIAMAAMGLMLGLMSIQCTLSEIAGAIQEASDCKPTGSADA